MDYPKKTLTRDGSALLANDDADGARTIIDYVITSDQLPDNSEELDDIEVGDFHNPKRIKINSYQHQGATFQPEATWDNTKTTLTNEYPIQMFGLLAHGANDNDSDETLLAVAVSDDSPFIMPATNKVPFTFTMALTLTYSNANNITADVTNTDAVTHSELSDVLANFKINLNKTFETISNASSAYSSLSSNTASAKSDLSNSLSKSYASNQQGTTNGFNQVENDLSNTKNDLQNQINTNKSDISNITRIKDVGKSPYNSDADNATTTGFYVLWYDQNTPFSLGNMLVINSGGNTCYCIQLAFSATSNSIAFRSTILKNQGFKGIGWREI